MGAYDSVYARCNCDWPDDERCKALPDDQTRWFNHLLWLESVRQKSSILPERFDAAHWAKRLSVSVGRVEEMVKAMAAENLVGWSQDGRIVVCGSQKNHPKLGWNDKEPQKLINPFKRANGWGIVRYPEKSPDTSTYPEESPDTAANPVKSPTVEKSIEEKRRVEESRAATARARAEVAAAASSPPSELPGDTPDEDTPDEVPAAEVIRAWNVVAVRRDWPRCSKVPDGKSGEVFRACLKDPFFARNYRAALDILAEVRWNKQPFRITTFMKPDAVRALIDGEWSNPTGLHNGVYTGGQDLGF